MTVITDTKTHTAHHEAAHAVASHRAGGCPSITLVPTDGYFGACKPDGLANVDDRTSVRVCLAGPAMELERGEVNVRETAWADFDCAAPYVTANGWDEAKLLSEARAWVRSEIAAITAVAEPALLDDRLDDTEIAIVIGDADHELEAPRDVLLTLHRAARAREATK